MVVSVWESSLEEHPPTHVAIAWRQS